jgi:hypothetical protein
MASMLDLPVKYLRLQAPTEILQVFFSSGQRDFQV